MDVNLVMLKKDGSQKTFPLPSSVTIIGRRRNCDLRIPVKSVSKRHCQLSYHNGILKIRDLGSRNGTRLNGKRIDEAEIKPGDSLKIGPLAFAFQIGGEPEIIESPKPKKEKQPKQQESKEIALDEQFASVEELNLDDSDLTPVDSDLSADDSDMLLDDPDAMLDDADLASEDSDVLLDDSGSMDFDPDMLEEDDSDNLEN